MKTEKKSVTFKATASDAGEFSFLVSDESIDRDGEIVEPKGLKLPKRVPVYMDHDHNTRSMVATGTPVLDGDSLRLDGKFLKAANAQLIREMLSDPDHASAMGMSIGFMSAKRTIVDGVPHVTEGELVEVSFTGIPSNRNTELLSVKSAVRPDVDVKSIAGSFEALSASIVEALRSVDSGYPYPVATFPDSIVYETLSADGQWITERRTYSIDGNGIVSLGDPEAVTVETVVTTPKNVDVETVTSKPDIKSVSDVSVAASAAAAAAMAAAVLALD